MPDGRAHSNVLLRTRQEQARLAEEWQNDPKNQSGIKGFRRKAKAVLDATNDVVKCLGRNPYLIFDEEAARDLNTSQEVLTAVRERMINGEPPPKKT